MKTGQAPLRTFGDLKQFFDIQTGADDSAEKKLSKKKKSNRKVEEAGSTEPVNHSVRQDSLDEVRVQRTTSKERTTPKDSEDVPAGGESSVKIHSIQDSEKNIAEELEKDSSPQVPDATAPTIEQQSDEDSSKDTSQQ
jgi:hypothetical protein